MTQIVTGKYQARLMGAGLQRQGEDTAGHDAGHWRVEISANERDPLDDVPPGKDAEGLEARGIDHHDRSDPPGAHAPKGLTHAEFGPHTHRLATNQRR